MRGKVQLGGRLLVAGLFAWGLGCGGDDDDDTSTDDGSGDTSPDDDSSGDATDDGGDANTTLDQLTADEAQAFCEDVLGIFSPDDFLEFGCTFVGIGMYPDDVDACNTAVQDCIDSQESPGPVSEPVCFVDPTDVPALPDCAGQITVGELQACMEAFFDEFRVVLDSVTCETSLEEVPPFPSELPEECAALQAECPDLFGTPG
jgi:hypothetical protein